MALCGLPALGRFSAFSAYSVVNHTRPLPSSIVMALTWLISLLIHY